MHHNKKYSRKKRTRKKSTHEKVLTSERARPRPSHSGPTGRPRGRPVTGGQRPGRAPRRGARRPPAAAPRGSLRCTARRAHGLWREHETVGTGANGSARSSRGIGARRPGASAAGWRAASCRCEWPSAGRICGWFQPQAATGVPGMETRSGGEIAPLELPMPEQQQLLRATRQCSANQYRERPLPARSNVRWGYCVIRLASASCARVKRRTLADGRRTRGLLCAVSPSALGSAPIPCTFRGTLV